MKKTLAKVMFGFTPHPDCRNCHGTGVFSTDELNEPDEPCIFCMEDGIKTGELDGTIDGVDYVGGKPVPKSE